VLGAWSASQGKQKKDNGKAKAGSGGAGGGLSNKAAAAGSSGQGSSGQGSSPPSAPPALPIGFRTEEPAMQVAPSLAAGVASGGSTKKEKEKLRKERQRLRKVEEALEALRGAMELMEEETAGASSVDAVEKAMQAAAKHEARSEALAALLVVARDLVEQARAAEAERVRVAAEEAAAAAAVEAAAEAERAKVAAAEAAAAAAVKAAAKAEAAAERLQMEEQLAALTLRMQNDARRMRNDACTAGAADASSTGRASGGTRAAPRCGRDTVRGVQPRTQPRTGRCGHACTCACVRRARSC
jgi:hypothetical protein